MLIKFAVFFFWKAVRFLHIRNFSIQLKLVNWAGVFTGDGTEAKAGAGAVAGDHADAGGINGAETRVETGAKTELKRRLGLELRMDMGLRLGL